MSEEYKKYILDKVGQTDGDDLERATAAFGRLSEHDLDKQYGQSGAMYAAGVVYIFRLEKQNRDLKRKVNGYESRLETSEKTITTLMNYRGLK